jgi:hypothetical protein
MAPMNLRPSGSIYREFRADGWPLCPRCGEDELWSNAIQPTIETIVGCYFCRWEAPR